MTENQSPLSEPSLAVKFVRRFLLPLGVTVLCALGAVGLSKLRSGAARDKPEPQVPLVQVIVSRVETLPAHIRVTGNVEAARELNLIPEVSGRVTYVSPNLVAGGRVKKGETLVRIDGSTYALQAREQHSQVRKAESDLKLEQGRQEIAKQEWEMIGDGRPADEADLPLRKPQLASAKWNLDAAESSLKRARLNLSRTSIRAPMDAVVVAEQVEKGQVVAPGFQIGSLMGVEQFWVRVSVPVARLDDIQIPGLHGEQGSEATVVQRLGDARALERKGTVLRLLGQLDAKTRTAQVLIAVENPLAKPDAGSPVPILPGAYVEVDIVGRAMAGVIKLPRSALTGGAAVWVVDEHDLLARRAVEIRWGDSEDVYIGGELKAGERVVVSPMALPLPGQHVKIEAATPAAAGEGAAAPAAKPAGSAQ